MKDMDIVFLGGMSKIFVAAGIWSQHLVEVRYFLVLFQKLPNLPGLTTFFLLSFFQNAVIWRTIKIIT